MRLAARQTGVVRQHLPNTVAFPVIDALWPHDIPERAQVTVGWRSRRRALKKVVTTFAATTFVFVVAATAIRSLGH